MMTDDIKNKSQGNSLDVFIAIALFVFGSTCSVIFLGYQLVPNPDFFGFIEVARAVVSWQFSAIDYRQLPGLGLLQLGLSFFIEGEMAELKAGWLLNAMLFPCNIVLVWLIGKRINGASAVWVAILVAINPFVLHLAVEPIAETTFLFFILLTFYCIFRQSNFAYLVAGMATMIRYEGAALILAAVVFEMMNSRDNKERVRAFLHGMLAGIPLVMWLLLTFLHWDSQGSHYINTFSRRAALGHHVGVFPYIDMMWKMSFLPLYSAVISIVTDALPGSINFLSVSKMVIFGMLIFGTIHGFMKRNWEMLALHIFLWPYIFIHSAASVLPRHGVATHWILLIIFLYGLQHAWMFIDKRWPIHSGLLTILKSLTFIFALIFIWKLSLYQQRVSEVNQSLMFVLYGAVLTVIVVLLGTMVLNKGKDLGSSLLTSILVCCMIVVSQPRLVDAMGEGKSNFEFKLLADWYKENAEVGEKMVVGLAYTTGYFSGGNRDAFLFYKNFKSDSPADFIQQCHALNVTYVTWDSIHGLKGVRREVYYNKWRMENIDLLEDSRNVGPYTFITQIKRDEKHYINVFRLSKKE